MKKIPVFLLVIMFVAVVVYGILLNQTPALPPSATTEAFETSLDFCSGNASAECPRFYNYLSPLASFKALSANDKKAKVEEYIAAYNSKKNDQFFKVMREAEQNAHLFTVIDGGSIVTEGSRTASLLSSVCPSSASKYADGTIVLEPSGQTFSTMTQYLDYMTKLLNKPGMEMCVIPEVKNYEGPLPGVLGGLGSGTISGNQVNVEGRDRSVINTALQYLFDRTGDKQSGGVTMLEQPGEQTSAQTPINKLDDYEYSRIFDLDNQPRISQLSQDAKNSLTNQYTQDWSVLPFSSDKKAALEEEFVAGRLEDGFREPKTGIFFRNMEGVDIEPPNDDVANEREQKIMAAYKPTDISTHVVDDETERVARVVSQTFANDPDWEPVVERRGKHQYAITELRPKAKKERFEAEAGDTPTIQQAQDANMLTGKTYGPQMTIVDNQRGDPFFDKAGVVDYDNNRVWKYNDFTKWTPGLERMFAPTNDTQAWF